MKTPCKISLRGLIAVLQFAICILHFAFCISPLYAAEPCLARLSFWLPPNRMPEFEAVYNKKIVPVLKAHGLKESPEHSRATVDSVFARLFELKSPSELGDKQRALGGDPAWQAALRELGTAFGTARQDSLIQSRFRLYAMSAGSGKVVSAGRGRGHWRSYDVTDGLAGVVISVYLDRKGYLWFGTYNGVSRYDGDSWTTFTTQDGLASNIVSSIFQDREGNLWFGTHRGVSRYDGETFTPFMQEDGLAPPGGSVVSILQDREGNFWFAIEKHGVSRYDGNTWTTFTTDDGLPSNLVRSIFEDREGYLWFGTWGGGVSRYDGNTWTTFRKGVGLQSNTVFSIFQDREGYLWFGTYNGVSRYDGKTFTTFTTEDGLVHNVVRSIFEDREGHLWFGTSDGVSQSAMKSISKLPML